MRTVGKVDTLSLTYSTLKALQNVFDVPAHGPPVAQTPSLEHECTINGFRAVVLPPGRIELAAKSDRCVINLMPRPGSISLLRVEDEDLSGRDLVGHSLCWTPSNADLRIVCTNVDWEVNLELDPARVASLAHEALDGRPLTDQFVYWHEDRAASHAAELLIQHLRQPIVDNLYAEGLMLAAAVRALRLAAGELKKPPTNVDARRVDQVYDYIEAQLDEKIAIATLSRVAGMSPHQFTRTFKARTGKSPHRYVVDRRVQRARELLVANSLPIAHISVACGFSSQSHMTDVFQQRLGVTPGRFRLESRR